MSTRRGLRNLCIYLGFSMGNALVGLGSVTVLARLLSPHEYGLIGVFLSVLFCVAPIVSLSADGLVGVSKTSLDAQGYEVFQRSYVALAYCSFALLQLAFAVGWLAGAYADATLLLAPLFGLARFLAGMAGTEYVAEQRPVMHGVMTLLTSVLALALTVALVLAGGEWGGFRILGLLLADLLMIGVRYRGRMDVLLRPRWQADAVRQIVRFGVPSMLAVAGAWALNESDKIIVARQAGMAAAGVYAAAAAMASVMLAFNQSLTNAMYPEMFRKLAQGAPLGGVVARYAARFVGLSTAFCTLVVGGYLAVGHWLLPARYLGAQPVFIALMAAGIASSLYRPFGLLADYYKLARVRALGLLCGGGATIAIGYAGVAHGGPVWAALGVIAGYLLMTPIIAAGLLWTHRNPS